ncbi:MAG: hypothetical protein KF724_12855 [Phycisphaeraceae bacterium]|nr:hypothetical protein [Phycisphaeraceae bacterium]
MLHGLRLTRPGVDRDLVDADQIIIEVVRLNGAVLPEKPFSMAMERLKSHVRGSVMVVDRGSVHADFDEDGELVAMHWPIHALDPQSGERRAVERPCFLAVPDGGVIGLSTVHDDDPTSPRVLMPIPASNAIVIVVADRGPSDRPAAGSAHAVLMQRPDQPRDAAFFASREIWLFADRIQGRTCLPFVHHDAYWSWIVLHEIGHALGVPAADDRSFHETGRHCVRPDCIMYSPADWRMALQIVLHGWSLDFCEACAAELAEARSPEEGERRQR